MNRMRFLNVSHCLLAGVMWLAMAPSSQAGDIVGGVKEPDVLNPNAISSDVSAFYLGVSAGYANGGSDRFGLSTGSNTFPIGELEPNGTYGGVRGGWRGTLPFYGGRDYVYGIEIGYDFGTLEDDVSTLIGGTQVDAYSSISDVFSVRLRSGITNRSRSVLYFATIGYVEGDITTRNTLTAGGIADVSEDVDNRSGFSASAGVEHRLNENWSITGEIEYLQFDSERVQLSNGLTTKSTPSYRGLRFGLNYTF